MRLRLTIFNIKQVFLPVTGLLILLATATYAQVDTIDQRHQRLNTAFLKPGVRQYLVYFQLPTRSNMLSLSLWVREIEKTNRNNVPVFKTTQHWYSEDTARYAMFTSFNTVSDFSPLFHEEIRGKDRKAYNWSAQGVAGDSGPDNKAADFKFDFDRPNYNWHLDIETFEMLPLAKGKIFEINFYDAGLDTPKYVRYQVTGSDVLQTLNNQAVDCWKLFTEGESPRVH